MVDGSGYDGIHALNTGGSYSPNANSWTATSTTNAADARISHSAIWTGSEMIVWGGSGNISAFLTPVGDTTPLQIAGQQPAPPMRLKPDTFTPPSGPAPK